MPSPPVAPDVSPVATTPDHWQSEFQRLQVRERHLQSLLDSARDAVVAVDERGDVTDWNPSAERLLGWTASEVIGRPLTDFIIPPEYRAAHSAGMARHAATGESRILNRLVEVEALRKDGSRFPVELSVWKIEAAQGQARFGAFLRDISERSLAQHALEEAHARYKSVVDQLGEGMMLIQDGRIVFANPQAAEILQVPADSLLGMPALELLHPEDRAAVAARLGAREQGETVSVHSEIRRLLPDGSCRWLGTHSSNGQWQGRPATMTFFADITGSKALIDALHQSEERYRAVIEHVGEGMVVVKGTRFVFANRRAAEIVQMTIPEMLENGYLHRIHPEDRPKVDERRRQRLAGEAVPDRYEIRLLLPGNVVRWIDIGVTILPWDGDTGTLTFFSDVTERKALEEKLTTTLEERETILESSIVGIAFLTPSGRMRWANRAMLEIFGADGHGPLPQTLEAVYSSREEYLRVGGEVAQAIARGDAYQTELQMRRLDGSLLWVSLSGKAVNQSNLSQGTVWVMMDISRRKELEVALQRTSSEREAILNTALVGIMHNVGRIVAWANDKYAEMMGYERTELIGQSSRIFYDSDEDFERSGQEMHAALERDGEYSTERLMRRRDGSTFWALLAGRCVEGRNPEAGIIWTALDITARKRAEEDIRVALAQQKELNDLRSRFVAMTSHEFRTPLATILSSAELLRFYGDRMERDERNEILESIESGVQRMTRMLDRVLMIGKSDANMLEYSPTELDLGALCRALAQEAQGQRGGSLCDLEVQIAPDLGWCVCDEKLLRHILGNLLSNAIKYSPRGGTARFTVQSLQEKVRFEVADEGIGIPAQELGHLFESFHRASNVGDIQGTGLGLAIVKKAVELHGGLIEVRSTVGAGTCFTVILPIARARRSEH